MQVAGVDKLKIKHPLTSTEGVFISLQEEFRARCLIVQVVSKYSRITP
jgi:hypothetical protein